MATYNGAKYIKEQIDSILSQEFRENGDVELELIISDDGSMDKTIDIVKSYNDDRIKLVCHREHRTYKYYKGLKACTRNFAYAMEFATGEYIFLSDQDDVWYPNKMDVQLSLLKQKGGCCAAAFYVGDESLKIIGEVVYKPKSVFSWNHHNSLYGFSCAFTRDFLQYIMPMPDIPWHDTFIMLTAQWRGKLFYIDEKTAIHRWTGSHNTSGGTNRTPYGVRLYYWIKAWIIVLARYYF